MILQSKKCSYCGDEITSIQLACPSCSAPPPQTEAAEEAPAPLLPSTTQLLPGPRLATRWPRFFARIFDLWWESFLVGIIGTILFQTATRHILQKTLPESAGGELLFGMICIPFALVVDAIVYRVFSNTPGKALLGLQVRSLRRERLTLPAYLSRNFALWYSGLALGFPLVYLGTLMFQSRRLHDGKPTSYDDDADTRVYVSNPRPVRVFIFGLLFIALLSGVGLLRSPAKPLPMSPRKEVPPPAPVLDYQWQNSWTGRSTSIGGSWTNTSTQNELKQTVYIFSRNSGPVNVVLGMEDIAGVSLQQYVGGFVAATVEHMSFATGGSFSMRRGRPTWDCSGEMIKIPNCGLRVGVVQIGSRFFRIVTMQTDKTETTNVSVEELRRKLWSTIE